MLTVHLVSSSQVLYINKPLSLCRDKLYASVANQLAFVRFVNSLLLKRRTPIERVNDLFSFHAKRHVQENSRDTVLIFYTPIIVGTRELARQITTYRN